jgi:LPXTG-site transpeptidase (sortase) family protein
MVKRRIPVLVFVVAAVAAVALAWRVSTVGPGADNAGARPAAPLESSGPLAGVAIPVPEPTAPPVSAAPEATADPEAVAEKAPDVPALPRPDAGAQLARLVIPGAKVNHRIVVRGLTARREMEDPGGKDDVAWYNFSALPGYGSNAVLSGHVDWYTGQPGVFWYLRDLKEGDEVQVQYTDGMVLRYRVNRIEVYGTDDAPVAEITSPTPTDTLTMITCDGVFSKSTREYTKRRVVWAERVA